MCVCVNGRVTIYEFVKRRTPQRALVTHPGPTTGGGVAHDRNTPRAYDRRGAGASPAGRIWPPVDADWSRTLVSQKGGQIRIWLDAAPDAGQGIEKPDSPA